MFAILQETIWWEAESQVYVIIAESDDPDSI